MIIIPTRLASTRFPNKPLAKIHGREMILHVCDRCSAVDNIYVATPDVDIIRLVENNGYRAVLTGDHITGTDRIAEVAEKIDDPEDIYINVQGDSPAVNLEDVKRVIETKRYHHKFVVGTMCRMDNIMEDNINVVKVIQNAGQLVYLTRKGGSKFRQCGLYAFNKEELRLFSQIPNKAAFLEMNENIELMRFIEIGYPVHMVEVAGSPEVDVPEDIKLLEHFIQEEYTWK